MEIVPYFIRLVAGIIIIYYRAVLFLSHLLIFWIKFFCPLILFIFRFIFCSLLYFRLILIIVYLIRIKRFFPSLLILAKFFFFYNTVIIKGNKFIIFAVNQSRGFWARLFINRGYNVFVVPPIRINLKNNSNNENYTAFK